MHLLKRQQRCRCQREKRGALVPHRVRRRDTQETQTPQSARGTLNIPKPPWVAQQHPQDTLKKLPNPLGTQPQPPPRPPADERPGRTPSKDRGAPWKCRMVGAIASQSMQPYSAGSGRRTVSCQKLSEARRACTQELKSFPSVVTAQEILGIAWGGGSSPEKRLLEATPRNWEFPHGSLARQG